MNDLLCLIIFAFMASGSLFFLCQFARNHRTIVIGAVVATIGIIGTVASLYSIGMKPVPHSTEAVEHK